MSETLDRLAARAGVALEYATLAGDRVIVSEAVKRAALAAMGIPSASDDEAAASLDAVPALDLGGMHAPAGPPCYVPPFLDDGRCWGITCQLYGLRSARNLGIGDFEDLARFAEIAAAAGADFVGVNPLHALFLADPTRASPFFPSSRRFLNPLYIALDRLPGWERVAGDLAADRQRLDAELVDYAGVTRLKRRGLESLFRLAGGGRSRGLARFRAAEGRALHLHALFEAVSEFMVERGESAAWHGWPLPFRDPEGDAVRRFAETHRDRVAFHAWLQWVADAQLASVQARARRAGLRIGLYLDLAVGVAPDGSATWSDPGLVVAGARIGSPPDHFNRDGQDWGLAPLSPTRLAATGYEPFRDAMTAVLRNAGAVRIDHAMSLYRLFWILAGTAGSEGVYVRYPFSDLLRVLTEVSRERRAMVIGEDLGVVPEGFREVMRAMEVQGYRVFLFEKRDDHFIAPSAYPREALACLTTHDLPTLAGWWCGRDIVVRSELGVGAAEDGAAALEARWHERRRALWALAEAGLLPDGAKPYMTGEREPPAELPEAVALAFHRLVARTPSRLFAAAVEDLIGAVEQVNLPGTVAEHPNWCRRLSCDLEALPRHPRFRSVTAALRRERPRPPADG